MLEALIAFLFEFAVNMFQGILDYLSENLRPEKKMVIFLILLPITLLLIVFFFFGASVVEKYFAFLCRVCDSRLAYQITIGLVYPQHEDFICHDRRSSCLFL